MSDRAMLALRDGLRPGLSERQLGDMIERAYVADGGSNVIPTLAQHPYCCAAEIFRRVPA